MKFLTPEEIAAKADLHVVTVRRIIQRGELPAYKLAGQWRVEPEDFDAWLASSKVEPGVVLPRRPRARRVRGDGFQALVGGRRG